MGGVKLSERDFRTRRVIPFLKELKNTSYFPIQQVGISGDADFILCARGLFVWCELKRDGEVPQPLQKFKADWVVRTHGIALVATPITWRTVKVVLQNLDQGVSE